MAASASPSTTGREPGPSDVAIGDVNGDGNADVVSANGSTDPNGDLDFIDTVSVLLGSGDGTLRAKRDYRVSDEYSDARIFITIRIADVNGDRKPDLVTADVGDDWAMTVLVNGGHGTFRHHFDFGRNNYTSQEVGQGSEAVALGDLNGDHRMDVVEARSDEVSVFVNAPGWCTVPDVSGRSFRPRGECSPNAIAASAGSSGTKAVPPATSGDSGPKQASSSPRARR